MYSAVHDLIIDDRELRVSSNGTGRPILMLHDLGGAATDFQALTSPLVASDRELVVVDLPGSGHSDPPPGAGLHGVVEVLSAALPRLSDTPLDLVGCGFGAYLAACLAAQDPGRIDRLVLVDPMVPPRSGPPAAHRMPPGMAVSGAFNTLRRGKLKQNLSGFSRARTTLDQLSRADPAWWTVISNIRADTLVLGADHANPGQRAVLDLLTATIPGARQDTLPGGPRGYASAPTAFATRILHFCPCQEGK